MDDAAIVEIMAVVDFFNASNRVTDGLQLESDVLPKVDTPEVMPKTAGSRSRTKSATKNK